MNRPAQPEVKPPPKGNAPQTQGPPQPQAQKKPPQAKKPPMYRYGMPVLHQGEFWVVGGLSTLFSYDSGAL
jgi:hypothetical protein